MYEINYITNNCQPWASNSNCKQAVVLLSYQWARASQPNHNKVCCYC